MVEWTRAAILESLAQMGDAEFQIYEVAPSYISREVAVLPLEMNEEGYVWMFRKLEVDLALARYNKTRSEK